MNNNTLALIISFVAGVLCILASILNWNWFFENRRAYIFVKMFGRTGARVFYSLLGLLLFFLGFKMLNIF